MDKPITVLLVDDHKVVRQGVRAFLEAHTEFLVVGEAASGTEAVKLTEEHIPDVVLMDLIMPEMDGVEATRQVKNISPRTQIVVLTSYHDDEHIFPALEAGAISYILKDVVPSINSEIAKILEMLDIPLTVMFDEEFNVHIYRFGEEVSLTTISTGQRKMTDCAILLSITIILRMKYQFNVTFYDEILSSIDSDNRPILLEIIKEICCNKLKLHTFVMNHDYIPSSYFDYVVSIKHQNNFSSVKILTQDQYESQFLVTNGKESKESVENLMIETQA